MWQSVVETRIPGAWEAVGSNRVADIQPSARGTLGKPFVILRTSWDNHQVID